MNYRHGEVFLQKVSELPKRGKKHKEFIVGHSETGHHHVLEAATKFEVSKSDKELFIRLFEPGKIVHKKTYNTHKPIVVEPGTYKIIKKQEYNPFEKVMQDVWD